MVTRLLTRIKTAQVLYAYLQGEKPLYMGEEELRVSLEATYELYNYLLGLVVKVTECREKQIIAAQNKYLPTYEEKYPNKRFIYNPLVRLVKETTDVMQFCEEHNLYDDFENDLYEEIIEKVIVDPVYVEYMNNPLGSDLSSDKEVWVHIFNNILPKCTNIHDILEEKNIYWNDDFVTVLRAVVKTISRVSESNQKIDVLPLFELGEDETYAFRLFRLAVEHYDEYLKLIDKAAENWEVHRIAPMEKVLIILTLTEIYNFPEIPFRISMYEYIELSKYYCAPDSARFINGLIDTIYRGKDENSKINNKRK